jgi:hypothetical protein
MKRWHVAVAGIDLRKGKLMQRLPVSFVAAVALAAGAATGLTGCKPPGLETGTCLRDDEICQFRVGMTTEQEIRDTLGKPETSSSGMIIYLCNELTVTGKLRNDVVSYGFDDNHLLSEITVVRQGEDAPPAPSCATVKL